MLRALFVLRTKAAVLENLPIADALRQSGWDCEFLIDPQYAEQQVPLIIEAGFAAFHPSGARLSLLEQTGKKNTGESSEELIVKKLLRIGNIREMIFMTLPAVVRFTLHYHSRVRRMRNFLQTRKPAIVLLSGDRQLGWELACIKAAKEYGIATLITPYAIQFAEGIAVCRVRRSDYRQRFLVCGVVRSIVAKFFPDWTFVYRGQRMLYYPVSESLAAHFLGLMPKKPWTVGGGDVDFMAVESAYARKIFLEDGVSADHMVVTGKPCNDSIAIPMDTSHVKAMRDSLGVLHGNAMLLCSIPQLAEHNLLSWDQHLQEVDFLLSTFASLVHTSVVLSLHPKSDLQRYQPIADKYGARIATQRIYLLQPACDVFVAGVSSTVTQAIGIGKPAVVIDYFGLDDRHYYDSAPGVVVVRDREKLRPALEAILCDQSYYESLQNAQREQGVSWAMMDGQCTRRMVEVIEKMARRL